MKNKKKIFLLMAATSFILLSCSDRSTTNPSGAGPSGNSNTNTSSTGASTTGASTPSPEESLQNFSKARDKTVNSEGFTYSDKLDVKTTAAGIAGPTALRTGETKYSSTATTNQVGYYQHFTSSGALLYDGQSHSTRTGTKLTTVKQNEDGLVTSVKNETVAADFKYDSSTFAKAIFEYKDADLKAVTAAGGNSYKIETKTNATSVISKSLEMLENPLVGKIITALANVSTEPSYSIDVTLTSDGYIDTYTYNFSLDVTVYGQPLHMDFSYFLDFSSYTAQTITAPDFPGVGLTPAAIDQSLTTTKTLLNSYKALANSAYDYDLSSKVSYGIGNSYSLSYKGLTKRNIDKNVVYFNNRIAMDQANYLDSANKEYSDYSGNRGRTSDGKVHDVHDKFGPVNDTAEVTTPNKNDEFYFLPGDDLLAKENYDLSQAETKNNVTTTHYSFNVAGAQKVFSFLNSSVRLEPLNSPDANLFGTFDSKTIVLEDMTLSFVQTGTAFTSMTLKLSGDYTTQLYANNDQASFDVVLTIKTNDQGANYKAPAQAKDLNG